MKKKDVAKNIRESLGIEGPEAIQESLVAQPKPFSIPTESLSGENIRNHYSLYEQYIKDFNAISAKLDTADRNNASSNHSAFRSLKIDEVYNLNAAYLHELWQHAYYKDYLKDVKDYTINMMRELNWNVIEERFKRTDKIAQVVRD